MAIGYKNQTGASVNTPNSGESWTYIDSADGHFKRKDSTGTVVDIESVASGVTSFEGRGGAVTSASGDYTASEVTNVPSGNIVATNVQAAIEELDSEKAPLTHVGGGGVSEHPVVTGSVAGFMSPSDFTKLAGIESGATAATRSNSNPVDVGTATPGVSTEVSRADHVHAHGNQAGGSLHANSTTSVAGFMSAADKTKLDGVEASANNTILSSTAPNNIGTAAAGVSTEVSRQDHVHAHGSQGGASEHLAVTTSVNGFMSAADKTKLDGIEAGANLGIDALTGEVSASGDGSVVATVSNAAVIAKVLTGFSETYGQVLATDSILSAIAKLSFTQNMHQQTINQSFTVPDGFNLIRGSTTLGSGVTLSLDGTASLTII